MSSSRNPGPLNPPQGAFPVPSRTPGPLGNNDQGDPNITARLGDTPGPLGHNDQADPSLPQKPLLAGLSSGSPVRTDKGVAVSTGSKTSPGAAAALKISGVVVAGGPLSDATIVAVNAAAEKTPAQWRRYVAYETVVKVGGSLAWRANNPGNLRDASTKIGSVSGAVGHFAVFASLEEGRTAQRNLYLNKYGDMKVRDAIDKLTPPSENDTAHYLAELQKAGVSLDKDVKSQIDALMKAVEANEGLIVGIEVVRIP